MTAISMLAHAALCREMMTALKAAGHDREDHSGLVQHYESLAQTSLVADQA